LSTNVFYLTPMDQANILPPNISVLSVQQLNSREAVLTVASETVAPFVMISTALAGRFNDNGILMLPTKDVPSEINFFGWEDFTVEELKESLLIKSIGDTY